MREVQAMGRSPRAVPLDGPSVTDAVRVELQCSGGGKGGVENKRVWFSKKSKIRGKSKSKIRGKKNNWGIPPK